MQVSALEEYGLRCALQLAKSFSKGPIPASHIAEKEYLSIEYASKIMYYFRRAGIVQSERGTQGGFYLTKNPSQISLQEIIFSLKPKKETEETDFCQKYTGKHETCAHNTECSLRPVWQLISSYSERVLSSLTLNDLINNEVNTHQILKNLKNQEQPSEVTSQ